MSKLEVRSFDRALMGAAISGELERAQEKGFKEGHEEGRKEGIREGIKEGIKEGTLQTLCLLVSEGEIPLETALKRTGMTEEEFKKAISGFVV